MEENKSELLIKKESVFDLVNPNDNSNKDLSNITQSKLYNKLVLKKILDNIKNIQLALLFQKSLNKNVNKLSYDTIKNLLKDLKVELSSNFRENEQKNTKIKYRPNEVCDHSVIKNMSGIYSKNIIVNPKLISELSNLKFINFKLENQISLVDTKIRLLSDIKLNGKNTPKFSYLFLNGKNESIEAYNSLHSNLLDIRDKFKTVVKKKEFQNNIMLQLTTAIDVLKEERQLKNKKYKNEYIITSQIINEESKEYPTKTSSFENDNYCDKEKINSNIIENDFLYKGKLIYI